MIPLLQSLDSSPSAVATRRLHKCFGKQKALQGLELTVPREAVYVLVGPNGAGKTTTLRLLLDLVRADEGTAAVFGLSTAQRGAQVRAHVGYVPDTHRFGYTDLSVQRFLEHHAAYYPSWDEDYAGELLRHLDVRSEATFGTLSKGQARRVQLVQALAHRPPLLLLDEPTDGLDPLVRDQVSGLLAEHLASTPTTVLLSTHLTHEVEGLGDHLGVLRGGRLVAQLERGVLAERLHRVRTLVPEGWSAPQDLDLLVLQQERRGREWVATLWGDREESRDRLAAAGATVQQIEALNLEQAVLVLLQTEVS